MTRYMEEKVMTEYLVVGVFLVTITRLVGKMLFMEEKVMTEYVRLGIQRYMEKVVMTP